METTSNTIKCVQKNVDPRITRIGFIARHSECIVVPIIVKFLHGQNQKQFLWIVTFNLHLFQFKIEIELLASAITNLKFKKDKQLFCTIFTYISFYYYVMGSTLTRSSNLMILKLWKKSIFRLNAVAPNVGS